MSSPHVLPYIKELWIDGLTVRRDIFQPTLDILLGEPNGYGRYRGPGSLKKLVLNGIHWRGNLSLSRVFACETLEDVSLQYISQFASVNLRYLPPGLKSLSLTSISIDDIASNDSLTAIDMLHTESLLSIAFYEVYDGGRLILDHIKSECIRSYQIFFSTVGIQRNYMPLLRDLPSGLHLSLIYCDDGRDYPGNFWGDLSWLASLRTLAIYTSCLPIYWIANTLKSLSQDIKLEALSLHVKTDVYRFGQIEKTRVPFFDIPMIKTLRSCQFTVYWQMEYEHQAALDFTELLRCAFEGPGQSFVTVQKMNFVWPEVN